MFAVVAWYLSSIGPLSELRFFNFNFKVSSDSWKCQSEVLKKAGPSSLVLSRRSFADRPREPASAGLSTVGSWFHSSTVVSSSILETLLATHGLSMEWSHCKTVVQSVHINVRSTVIMSAFQLRYRYCFCWGNASFPKHKASSVVVPWLMLTFAWRYATAEYAFSEPSPNMCNSANSILHWN